MADPVPVLAPAEARLLRAGQPVTFTLSGTTVDSCVLDPGDGRRSTEYWPSVNALVYDQPGRYRVRLVDRQATPDYEIAACDVEIGGPLYLSVEGPYPVIGRDVWPDAAVVYPAITGTDNTLGMLADPHDLTGQRIYYYWAYGIDHSVIARSTGTVDDPLALGEIAHAPVAGNTYPILDAGPVHYDPASGILLMLALGMRYAGRGVTYGDVVLLWSRDLGLTWQSAGPVVTQPVSFEQVAADPDAYGPYPNMGTSILHRPDSEGEDWLLCYFGQCEGPVLGARGNMANWNPCGVARANVGEVVAAIEAGRSLPPWQKRLAGVRAYDDWPSPGIDGFADTLTHMGGAFSNQVVWCSPLQRYLMVGQSINSRGYGVFSLAYSYDGYTWSDPQPLWRDTEEHWYATTPAFVAPFGHVGREVAVWFPVWQFRQDANGTDQWGATELQGVKITLW